MKKSAQKQPATKKTAKPAITAFQRLASLYETSQELATGLFIVMNDVFVRDIEVKGALVSARSYTGLNGSYNALLVPNQCSANFLLGKGQECFVVLDDQGRCIHLRAPTLVEVRNFVELVPHVYAAIDKYIQETERVVNTVHAKHEGA
jgi:hypothetical protein